MIRYAYRLGLIKNNVLENVQRKVRGKAKKKDTLTIEEIFYFFMGYLHNGIAIYKNRLR